MDAVLQWIKDNPVVTGAIITACIGGILSFIFSRRIEKTKADFAGQLERVKAETLKEIELHKAALANENSEKSAKRDYEYEARKRLYEQIEPLMFQLREASEAALGRVDSLCRTSRNGDLGSDGWLSSEGYYLRSTLYRLVLPLVILRLLQRKMTFVDMALDETYARKYQVLKIYSNLLTDDYAVASVQPSIPYRPGETGVQDPTDKKQGIYMGHLEAVMDAMVIKDDQTSRPMTFSEYNLALDAAGDFRAHLEPGLALFRDFRSNGAPVLARMVHLVGCINFVLLKLFAGHRGPLGDVAHQFLADPATAARFAWDPLAVDFTPCRNYLQHQLGKQTASGMQRY